MTSCWIKQGDTSPSLEAVLTGPDGQPVDLHGATVRFIMERVVDAQAAIVDAEAGKVRYDWKPGDTDRPGVFNAEFRVEYATGVRTTVPNSGYVTVHIGRSLQGGADS